MKVLLFPGSFNPMHFGHIRLLRAAIEELKPDVSIVSPTYRSSADEPDFATRSEIARAAVNNTLPLPLSEMVDVGTFGLLANDSAHLHETVEFYRELYKKGAESPSIWILLGFAGAKEARRWKFARTMAKMASVAASRDIHAEDAFFLASKGFAVKTMPFKPSAMGSERVRAVLAKGQQDSWRYVPRAVFRLLKERGLYGAKEAGCLP